MDKLHEQIIKVLLKEALDDLTIFCLLLSITMSFITLYNFYTEVRVVDRGTNTTNNQMRLFKRMCRNVRRYTRKFRITDLHDVTFPLMNKKKHILGYYSDNEDFSNTFKRNTLKRFEQTRRDYLDEREEQRQKYINELLSFDDYLKRLFDCGDLKTYEVITENDF